MYFSSQQGTRPRLPLYQTILCLVCVLILVGNAISLSSNLQSLKGASAALSQAARIGDRLQYLNVLIMDAESSVRGYFISGSDVFLGPTRTANELINKEFDELAVLMADNPSQLRNLTQLHTLINKKLALLNESAEIYKQGGLSEIVKIAKTGDGRAAMDEIRLQVVIMSNEQQEQLAARSATFYVEYQKAVVLGITINAMAILVIVLFYRLVRRSFYTRVAAELELKDANDNLENVVARRTEQLSVLSRHLIRVSEEEKAKLARELHDEMGANLTAISMDISAVADRLAEERPELVDMLQRARATLADTMELKRRIIENLRPSLLDNLGLSAAVHSYTEEFGALSNLSCDALIDGDVDAAGPMQAIAVFRIVQESLNNIVKYAQAQTVIVQLSREGDTLNLQIIDDGIGIDIEAVTKPKSHGLLGMRERALLLGGTLKVKRGINNVGTCVDASIPLVSVVVPNSSPHPAADGHIPSLPPYSIRPHTVPSLDGQSP